VSAVIGGYRDELDAARTRLVASPATVVTTAAGPIEYLDIGDGPPVLWVHGVVGGCDQAPRMTQGYLGDGFRIIAVSRFGYLRSPLPADSSAVAQADRYSALLDVLGIARVTVVGCSAGTSSSLQFALRHPDRCSGLVVWSPAVPPYAVPARPVMTLLDAFYRSDVAFWFLMRYAPGRMMKIMGVPTAVQQRLSAADRDLLDEIMLAFLPVSRRAAGIGNDIRVSNPDMNQVTLAGLTVPTMIIHAVDDPWGSHEGARRLSGTGPVDFVEIPDGGHLFNGHLVEVRSLIRSFAHAHAADHSGLRARMVHRRRWARAASVV
jgi:pimeloyl-ACP methyl ester carboxylesterase